jgi:hypothetical protein
MSIRAWELNLRIPGDLSVKWKRLPQRYLLLSYESPNTDPVPDQKDRDSLYLVGRRAKREKESNS